MRHLRRTLIGLAGAAGVLLAFGFVWFANAVMRAPSNEARQADGIVVLTGGPIRIAEGARLLDEGRAERLLISGVNQKTGRPSLLKLSGLGEKTFNCCVDLGYAALDTVGNATETQRWAEALHYNKLIVVTASYHMPRSLAELARVMPETELIPHPVMPDSLRDKTWWMDRIALRILVAEYVKFLPAAARLVVTRGVGPWYSPPVTSASNPPRVKS